MNRPNAIELSGVIRFVGDFTLGPLDFTIPQGGVIALVGNNGAGKTTLLDMLTSLGWADAGSVRVLGHDLPRDAAAVKARTAYVNPDMDYSAWGTVGNALDFLSSFYTDWDDKRCDEVLDSFRLSRKTSLSAHSFGERVKFLLVTAFAREPDLLLLDEPTIGLDVHAQQALCDWIGRLRQKETSTLVISTHQFGFLEQMADQLALLHHGKLLAMGRLDNVLESYLWLDVVLPSHGELPAGCRIIHREGDRARVFLDRSIALASNVINVGATIIEESTVSLQDLAGVLTQKD